MDYNKWYYTRKHYVSCSFIAINMDIVVLVLRIH